MTEVTQWLLGRTFLALNQRQLVRKVDEELSVAYGLPFWQYHDAGEIEVVVGLFLLAEVADHVPAIIFPLTEHVEIKGVNFVPNILVV